MQAWSRHSTWLIQSLMWRRAVLSFHSWLQTLDWTQTFGPAKILARAETRAEQEGDELGWT